MNNCRWSFAFLSLCLFLVGCESDETPRNDSPREARLPKDELLAVKSEPFAGPDVVPQPRNDAPEAKPTTVANRALEVEEEKEPAPEADPPLGEGWKALNKAKTLYFENPENGPRRVHILAEVCLRDGPLEVLLCRVGTKEHESILRASLDAREIHTALIAAGAKYGSTVSYTPEYKPATGDRIKVTLTYNKDGKLLTRPAQSWVHHRKTKKPMEHEWVFAGSRFFKDPDQPDAQPFYCANNGEVISIANFPDSMLDLPVKSSKEEADLGFFATTDRIPPLKTKVIVTLERDSAPKK
jgi:hypothetical protein